MQVKLQFRLQQMLI